MSIKKTGIIIGCLLMMAMILTPAWAQDVTKLSYPQLNKLEIPKVEKITLKNGIRLYILEDGSLPILEASVRVNCGSYLEPADKVGLAEICGEVMRTGGTSKWSGDKIDEMLEGVGASVETSIGMSSGNASVNALSEHTDLVLEILSEILRRPAFNEDKIELAKVGRRSNISRRNDDPSDIGSREFRKIIYGPESVFARHTEYATINTITRNDLVDFHKKYYHPENVQIALWGDFKRKDIVDKIKNYFGDWQRGDMKVPPPPKVDYKFESKVHYIFKGDVNQSNIYLGHIGGLIADDDYADRIVMNNVLGGGFGSRLFNTVRSKEGLAYTAIGFYTSNFNYPGVFYNYAATKSKSTCKAIIEIIKQIKGIQTDPPTVDEMHFGKDGYLNSFVFNFDTKAKVVNRMMNYDFYGMPEDFLQKEKEKVEGVTPEAVVKAAQRNLHPENLHVLVVGRQEDFDMPLSELGLGPVETIDITIPAEK